MRRRQVSQEPTLGEKFRIEEGKEVGKRARELYGLRRVLRTLFNRSLIEC